MSYARPAGLLAAFVFLPGLLLTSSSTAQTQADTVVRTATQPIHRGVASLVEELSIGVADGAEELMIGSITDMALGADGSIFAFDGQVPAIRHYGADGRFVRTIGRRGDGPGEYRVSSGIAVAGSGNLLVWDTYGWRMVVYGPGGDHVGQWSTPSGSSGSSTANFSRALQVDAAGRVVVRKTLFDMRNPGNRQTVWIRYGEDGAVIDTLNPPEWTNPFQPLVAAAGGSRFSMRVPFAPERFVALSPLGYFVAGYPSRYAFEIHRPGQPVLSIRRDTRAEPVPRAERNAERDRVTQRKRQTDPQWNWNGPDIPETKPLYGGLEIGLDGRVWVAVIPEVSQQGVGMSFSFSGGGRGAAPGGQRSSRAPEGPPPAPALYDVFEPDGRYVGQVRIPPKVTTVLRRGDHIWAVQLDEDDVPRIKRYRINWGNNG
jgi:hypothetical protein